MRSWRLLINEKYQFFDQQLGVAFGQGSCPRVDVECCYSTPYHLIVGTVEGDVIFFRQDWTIANKFMAYQTNTKLIDYNFEHKVLITMGLDEDTPSFRIKFWDVTNWDIDGYPFLFHESTLNSSLSVTCLAASHDLSTVVIGLCDGTLVSLGGNPRKVKDLRQKDYAISNGPPISGIYYVKEDESKEILYVTTTKLIQVYRVSNGNLFKEKELDKSGMESMSCGCITADNKLMLGKDEGIFVYQHNAKIGAHLLNSVKKSVNSFRSYCVIVEAIGQESHSVRHQISIYEMSEQLIVFRGPLLDVTNIIIYWNRICVVTKTGIWTLTERDNEKKMEILLQKHFYPNAISMATLMKYSFDETALIYQQHGDNLYNKKKDFNGAMKQYMNTIGASSVEPSSIIKKYLESQHNQNLTMYLEMLHEKNCANANHTTLLFNCFTKTKDFDKISEFLRRPKLVFDYNAVIRVCRDSGFFDFALDLAKRKKITGWHLKILIEDFKKYEEALAHIRTLDFHEAKIQIKQFGKVLLANIPLETTKFLMEICTDYVEMNASDEGKDKNLKNKKLAANPEEFIRIFVNQPKQQLKFLEYIVANQASSEKIHAGVNDGLLDCYLRESTTLSQTLKAEKEKGVDVKVTGTDKALHEARQKAIQFLSQQEASGEVNHALVLSNMHDFNEGTILLYEKMQLGNEIVQYYMENKDYNNVIKAVKKHGKTNPKLWNQALIYFSDQPIESESHLKEILNHLEQTKSTEVIQIVDVLSNSNHQLGVIQGMLGRHFQRQQKRIDEDYAEIAMHVSETKIIKKQIEDLQTKAIVFRNHSHLELPAVHFLSGQSFSVKEIPNKDFNPQTTAEYQNLKNRHKMLRANAKSHSEFFRQLESTDNGFGVISTYLGRGLLDKVSQEIQTEAEETLPTLDPNLFSDIGLVAI